MNEKKNLNTEETFALAVQNHQKNNLKVAENLYKETLKTNPNHVDAHNNLGIVFKELGELQKAVDCYQKVIQIQPDDAYGYYNLGLVFKQLGETQKAIDCFQKAIQIKPDRVEDVHVSLGLIFKELGEPQKAISCYEKAINIKPDYTQAYSNILFTLFFLEKYDSKYYLSQTKKFISSLIPIRDDLLLKYQFNTKPKKLKIGFVSGDFKQHPVGYFLLDTLRHLKNKNLELIAYSNTPIKDSLSVELKSHFTNWCEITGQNDEKVINQIRKDGIHILVDLSGHSGENRLPIFINKPAPIQVTWAGFLGSTGIPEIDYIIGDSFVTPLSENSHFTEKVFCLPNIWCCLSVPNIEIKLDQLPAIKNGHITFGSFNNLSKINDKVISLWSRILKAIPKSKIFLKTKELNSLYLKNMIINNFKKNNIDPDSIILEGFSPRNELLASYNRVDIALDPFPYSGGVTSFEAIWMGVPVLTKKGSKFVSNTTASINHNSGMSDWIANDENEYVTKAIEYSTNLERLSEIKRNLRQTAVESPLFNSTLFAKQLNNAFWEMWNNFVLKM